MYVFVCVMKYKNKLQVRLQRHAMQLLASDFQNWLPQRTHLTCNSGRGSQAGTRSAKKMHQPRSAGRLCLPPVCPARRSKGGPRERPTWGRRGLGPRQPGQYRLVIVMVYDTADNTVREILCRTPLGITVYGPRCACLPPRR